MKIYLVDDEPPAIGVIQALLEKNKARFEHTVIGSSSNPTEALQDIERLKPDVLFLDVEMPGLDGFDLLEKVQAPNRLVIFTTAHRDYAVDAFAANAFHYLVKPISPNAFKKCLEKIVSHQEQKAPESYAEDVSDEVKPLAIKNKDGYQLLHPNDIERLEANGAYTVFHLSSGKQEVYSRTLKHSAELLPKKGFLRISRSDIINSNQIASFSFQDGGSITLLSGQMIYIGKTYRKEVFEFLKNSYAK